MGGGTRGPGESGGRTWEPQGGDPGDSWAARTVGKGEGVRERGGEDVGLRGLKGGTWGQRRRRNQKNKD